MACARSGLCITAARATGSVGESDAVSEDRDSDNPATPKSPGLIAVIVSVFAAAFGVQTEKNRERDFAHGNPVVYIIAGIIFTAVFVLTIVGVVALVLPD